MVFALAAGILLHASLGAGQAAWSPVGPNNASVFSIAPSPHTDGEILVGTFFGGLYRTRDRGIVWNHVVSPFSSSPVFSIAYHPDQAGVIYVGTFGLGLFKSVDDGASWIPRNQGLPDATVSEVDVDPENPQVVLVASESGVFRSADGGESWSDTTAGLGISARALAFDPLAPGRVYLGARQNGTYRSLDGGETWASFRDGLGTRDVNALGFSPDGSRLYAATNSGVFALEPGQTQWDDMTHDLPETPVNQVVEHPVDERLFAATERGVYVLDSTSMPPQWVEWTPRPSRLVHIDAAGSPIYVAALGSELVATLDDGANFFDVSNGIQNVFGGALAAVTAGSESVIFGGSNNGVHITSRFFEQDGKLPWFSDNGFDEVVFVLAPHPTEKGTLFAGTERTGVWKSTDWGVNWEPSSRGIVPTRIYALSQSPVGNNTLYAGTNSGLYASRDDGATWESATGFAASVQILDVMADAVLPGVAYVSTDDGRVYKTIDDGASFQRIDTGLPADPVLELGAAPFGNLYAVTAKGELFVSFNQGAEWFPTASEIAEPVLSVATDPTIPWKAYVGTNGGGVYRSTTNGLTWEPVNSGLDVPFVFTVSVDRANGDNLYAGSVDRIFKSSDGGASWSSASAGLAAGFVQELIVDDDEPTRLFAFVAGTGIYRSSDGGLHWEASSVGAPFQRDVPLEASEVTPDKHFAGADVLGVMASADGGDSYGASSDGMTLFVRGLAISTRQPDLMYAGSLGGGIFRSLDGAANWAHKGLDDRNVFNVAIHPSNDAIAYGATSLGVVKTIDRGETWIELGQKASVIFTIVVDESDRNTVYIGSSAGNVFRSRDAGLTWTRTSRGLPAANILALAQDPRNGTLYAAGERSGVYKSVDDATVWTPTDSSVIGAFQILSLAVDGRDGTVFAAAGDNGVYRSTDGGASWQSSSAGFGGEVASHLAIDPSTGALYASALNQPGNSFALGVSLDGGASWMNRSAGLPGSVESVTLDPYNAGRLYAATSEGVYRSEDAGASWQPANAGLETTRVTAVLVAIGNSATLYAATEGSGVFRSLDSGATWVQRSLNFSGVDASSLENGANLGTVYLGSLTNGFFRSIDYGNAWLGGIEPELAEPIVTFLAIHPLSPDVVYAAASGVGLLKTTNGGITWEVIGEEIGNPFILAIAIDPVDPDTVYVGTTGSGVWMSSDSGQHWEPLNDGLFNLNVTSLLVDPVNHNIVYVGTEGGGIFANDRTPPPIDTDGDGVFDQVDCAPNDPRLATIHTFYHDYDKDSFGIHREEPLIPPDFNIETAVDVCKLAPDPGLVPWTNDPWDFDGFGYTETHLKSGRLLGVDVGFTGESGEFPEKELVDIGPDFTPLHVVWSDVETSLGAFDGPQAAALAVANRTYSERDLKVSLTLSPIVSGVLTVPDDLRQALATRSRLFNDPEVTARFMDFMTFVHGRLPDVEVVSVQIGYEIDKLIAEVNDASFWIAYVDFHVAIREHAKSLWGDSVRVSAVWSAQGFLNPDYDPLRELMTIIDDVVSLTYFPRKDDFTVYEPIEVPAQLQELYDRSFPKDVYFQSVGYPSAPIAGSSTTKQSQFLYALFEFWDKSRDRMRLLSFHQLHDISRSRADELADSPEFRAVGPGLRNRLVGYLSSLGFRTFDGAGADKSAYGTLRNHAFDRGWFRDVPRTARHFYLGFTQAPYDLPPDAPTQVEMFNWMRQHMNTDSDVSLVHLDGGVPWVEAFADDFSTAELPYSPGVRAHLQNDRDTIPPGNKIAVSINPLGVPRHLLAPYWGYGEGFDFDESFNRVPNGLFADADKRALPPPWDSYGFDSEEVRIAFLKYAMRIIDYFQPDYLVVGIEVSAALVQSEEEYEKYFELHKWLYDALKADPRYDHIPIMVSFSSTSYMVDEFGLAYKFDEQEPGVRDAQLDAFERFMPYTDIIGLSHYPHFGKYSAYTMPATLYEELFDLIDRVGAGDKPIAVTEGGYTADPYDIFDGFVYLGTPEKQQRHFRLLFRELHRRSNPVEFIINFKIRDSDIGWQRQVDAISDDTGEGSAKFVEFLQFFRDIGIYDGDGNLRPAGETWRAELALPRIPITNPGNRISLASASGDLRATFNVDVTKRINFELELGSSTLSSSLGITVDGVDLGRSVTALVASSPVTVQQEYGVLGVHSLASTAYQGYTLTAIRDGLGDPELRIEVRLYDDALAYRYIVPGAGPRQVSGEAASWVLPSSSPLWFQTDAAIYEGNYVEGRVGAVEATVGGPFTVGLSDGSFLAITEANVGAYSGMSYYAERTGTPRIRSRFLQDMEWEVEGGSPTPWRVILHGGDLHALVNSDVMTGLNEAPSTTLFPDGAATSWIRPGRALYSISMDPGSGFDYNVQKDYVDYAHQLGFEYVVVGPGWEIGFPYFGFANAFDALANLVHYAHTEGRNVDIVVWKPYFQLRDPLARQYFFAALDAVGAAGLTIEFFAGESREVNAFIETALAEAAARQLLVGVSNTGKPSGQERTYPNLVSWEAVRGLEWNGLGEDLTPEHNATLPFTRWVAGSADYRVVTFDPAELGDTTLAHQIATAGIFSSPLQTWSIQPELLLSEPDALDVVRALPSVWDETLVLPSGPSGIGELVAFARRSGDRWFLFVLNGSSEREATLPNLQLQFLGDDPYDAVFLGSDTPTSLIRFDAPGIDRNLAISIPMLPGSGFVAIFTPQVP